MNVVIESPLVDAPGLRARTRGLFRRATVPGALNLFPSSGWLLSSAMCAALVACSTDPPAPAVSRTPAPQEYEKTITNFFAFKIREPQKDTRISFSPPEPGSCALDGVANSMRGWVVPVVHETVKGEPGGREAIQITARPYYFWFLGNTIAAVTRRGDRCPGLGSAFDDWSPAGTQAGRLALAADAAPSAADSLHRARVDTSGSGQAGRVQHRTKATPGKDSNAQRGKSKVRRSAAGRLPAKAVRSHVNARIESKPSRASPKLPE